LVPGETEPVRGERCDDVGKLVAVDVVDLHVRAGIAVAAERALVEGPGRDRRAPCGLLPPPVRSDEVGAAVAVDVADADAVNARTPGTCFRDRVRLPRA